MRTVTETRNSEVGVFVGKNERSVDRTIRNRKSYTCLKRKKKIPVNICYELRTRFCFQLENHAGNEDLLSLINDVYERPIPGYKLSGYSILGENPRNVKVAVSVLYRSLTISRYVTWELKRFQATVSRKNIFVCRSL